MQSKAKTVSQYIAELPADRKKTMARLRKVIKENLPEGFKEVMIYGMPGYVVPHSLYPDGYHVDPKTPLPFMNLASQKNFVAIYHSGIYADKKLHDWFVKKYASHCDTRLDMGKSCIRLKNLDKIPYELIGELASKMTPEQWIRIYESNLTKAGK